MGSLLIIRICLMNKIPGQKDTKRMTNTKKDLFLVHLSAFLATLLIRRWASISIPTAKLISYSNCKA